MVTVNTSGCFKTSACWIAGHRVKTPSRTPFQLELGKCYEKDWESTLYCVSRLLSLPNIKLLCMLKKIPLTKRQHVKADWQWVVWGLPGVGINGSLRQKHCKRLAQRMLVEKVQVVQKKQKKQIWRQFQQERSRKRQKVIDYVRLVTGTCVSQVL